ncbi:MAG: hypothetical protein ACK5PB_01775 [Pirellula sp.]|jgi:hypothetical protein
MVKSNDEVICNVTSRLQEITSREPADDLDRFEARRGTEFLATMGILDRQTYKSFIDYTARIDRIDTLRDWIFNILEMVHSSGFVPEEEEQSEKIVQSVGRFGLYIATITENFLSDVYETRLSELSLDLKAAFGLARLEGRDEEDLKALDDRNRVMAVIGSVVSDDNIINLIRSNHYYQERLDRVMPFLPIMI